MPNPSRLFRTWRTFVNRKQSRRHSRMSMLYSIVPLSLISNFRRTWTNWNASMWMVCVFHLRICDMRERTIGAKIVAILNSHLLNGGARFRFHLLFVPLFSLFVNAPLSLSFSSVASLFHLAHLNAVHFDIDIIRKSEANAEKARLYFKSFQLNHDVIWRGCVVKWVRPSTIHNNGHATMTF